jgi:hypothetical protein
MSVPPERNAKHSFCPRGTQNLSLNVGLSCTVQREVIPGLCLYSEPEWFGDFIHIFSLEVSFFLRRECIFVVSRLARSTRRAPSSPTKGKYIVGGFPT